MQIKQYDKKSNSLSKTNLIAEILGILGETRRGKDWVLKEIKRHHLKIPPKTSLNSCELLNQCSVVFVTKLYRALKGEEVEGFEDVQSLARTYHWMFTDIVGGSNPTTPTKEQVQKIVVLNELMSRTESFRKRDLASTIILPVGDGVAVGFRDSAEEPLNLAIELHKSLFRYNETKNEKEKLYIRIGIDMGPVYFVKDLNGKDNVWGPGIILTRRVMDLCGPMNIAASAQIADNLRKLSPEYGKILHSIGNFNIKHGEELTIYNIYGSGFGNKAFPTKKRALTPDLQKGIRAVNNFAFNKISLKFEVLNPKTWLTRHVMLWDVVNISKDPMNQVFYFLDGDTPKEFSDLNVTIRDDNNNFLEILSVNVNTPFKKEFNVQLNKPIPPKKRRVLILEYDWEEPYRTYSYRFPTGCRLVEYTTTVPNEMELKSKIFKVDNIAGTKTEASPPPTITSKNGMTEATWAINDVMASESYQFDW